MANRSWWDDEEFTAYLPYIRVIAAHDVRAGKHARLELPALPSQLAARAVAYTAPCVSCGHDMHPFRRRRAPAKRGQGTGGMYVAVTCPLSENVGCARGREAADAYDQIESLAGYR